MAKYAKYTKHTIPKHNGHAALLEAQEIWDKDYRRGSLRDAVKRYFRKPDNPDKLTEPVIDKLFQGDRDEHDYRYRVAIEACAKLLQSEYETLFSPIPSVAGKMFKGTKPDFDQHLKAIWYNDYTSRFHNELPIPAKASENIRRRVKTIAEYVSRIPACNPLDLDLQQRIGKRLLTRGDGASPLVFYHWRQKHDHLHWVDFMFLRVLREFEMNGFEAHALVTEWEGRSLPASVASTVERLLGKEKLTTVTQAQGYEKEYMEYARTYAGDQHDIDAILEERDESARTWIPYIPYRVSSMKRPGYVQLVWERNKKKWEVAHSFNDDIERVQLFTKDVMIGGVRAKTERPPLLLEPVPCPSLCNWLFSPEQRPHQDEVKTLITHVSALEPTIAPRPKDARSEFHADWSGRLQQGAHPDLYNYVDQLTYLLEHWDREYLS